MDNMMIIAECLRKRNLKLNKYRVSIVYLIYRLNNEINVYVSREYIYNHLYLNRISSRAIRDYLVDLREHGIIDDGTIISMLELYYPCKKSVLVVMNI